jgi:hypothetical protein
MGNGWGKEVLGEGVLEGGEDVGFVEISLSVEFLGHLCLDDGITDCLGSGYMGICTALCFSLG